jgi:pyruvate/2-oxoacid:ferredoxin oxidoreductase alpha subunit
MLAIESGLSKLEEVDVVRIDSYLPNSVERINELEPNVVIIERNGDYSLLALDILWENMPLIVLDEAHRSIMVLNRKHVPTAGIKELTSVIEEIILQPEVSLGENL